MIGTIHKTQCNTHNNQSGGGSQTAPADHKHTIADITGLQDALDKKINYTDFPSVRIPDKNVDLVNGYPRLSLIGLEDPPSETLLPHSQNDFNNRVYKELYERRTFLEPHFIHEGRVCVISEDIESNSYLGRIIVCEGNADITIRMVNGMRNKYAEYRFLKLSAGDKIISFDTPELSFIGEHLVNVDTSRRYVQNVPQGSMIHLFIDYLTRKAYINVYPPYIASSGHRATVTPE